MAEVTQLSVFMDRIDQYVEDKVSPNNTDSKLGSNDIDRDNGSGSVISAYKSSYHYKIYGRDNDSNSYVTERQPHGAQEADEEEDDLIDWNEEFQVLVEMIMSTVSNPEVLKGAYITLSRLMQDFVHVCKTYAKVLVREKCLSARNKTIKPAALGGYAGGLKYLHAGIMFKFASSDHFNLYGSDARAAKAALHELRALREVFETRAGIAVPLLAVIDYCGHRILCSSILPLDHLVYGSSNGGKTVFASHQGFNEKMQKLGQALNIKGHYAGVSLNPQEHQFLYAPCDIEGHIGVDGRSYVIDLHRLLPPEAPTRKNSTEFLYRLLRPEFVRAYPKPLCSDAFSKFAPVDSDIHNQEITAATEYLKTKLIPQLGRFLDSLEASADRNTANLRLTELLHRRGINLRHLGLVRAATTKPNIRKALLVEMVARSFKNDLNSHLRHAGSTSKHPSNGPYKQAIVTYFNRIISTDQTFWTTHVKHLLEDEYYPGGLTASELQNTYSLRDDIILPTARILFSRIQVLTGVKLTEHVERQLDTPQLEVVIPDISKLTTKVHSPDFITSIEGMTLYIQSSRSNGPQADRLFEMAMAKLESAQGAAPGSSDAAALYGNALIDRSKLKSGEERSKLLRRAFDHYLSISDHERLFHFAKQLHQLAVDEHHSSEREKLFFLSSEAYKLALDVRKKLKVTTMNTTNSSNLNISTSTLPQSTAATITPITASNTHPSTLASTTSSAPSIVGQIEKSARYKKPVSSSATTTTSLISVPSTNSTAQPSTVTSPTTNTRRFGDALPINMEPRQKAVKVPAGKSAIVSSNSNFHNNTNMHNSSSTAPSVALTTNLSQMRGRTMPKDTSQNAIDAQTSSASTSSLPSSHIPITHSPPPITTTAAVPSNTAAISHPSQLQSPTLLPSPERKPSLNQFDSPNQPGDPEYYLNWGDLFYELGKTKSGAAAKSCFATAGKKYEQSWHEDPKMLLLRAAEVNRQDVMARIVESCIADGASSDLATIIAYFDTSPHLNTIDSKECPSLSDSVTRRVAAFQRIPANLLRLDAVPPALVSQGFEVTSIKMSGTELSDRAFQSPWPYLTSLEVRDCYRFTDLGLVWMSRFSTQLETLNLSKCVIGNLRMPKDDLLSKSSSLPPSLSLYFETHIASQMNPSSTQQHLQKQQPSAAESSQQINVQATTSHYGPFTSKTTSAISKTTLSSPTKKLSPTTTSLSTNTNSANNLAATNANATSNTPTLAPGISSSSTVPSSQTQQNGTADSNMIFVLSELHQMPKLVSLNLSECVALTDLGLYYLVRKSPSLTSLNISGCTNITTNGLVQLFQKRKAKTVPQRLSFDPSVSGGARTSRLLAFQSERKRFLEQQKRQLAESSDNSASFFLWSEKSPPSTSTPTSSSPSSTASSPVSSRASSPTRSLPNSSSSSSATSNTSSSRLEKRDPPPTPARLCLQSLDLSACSRIEDEALMWASWACPNLAKLRLAKMPLLTLRSLHYLIDNCPIRSLKLGRFSDLDDYTLSRLALNCPDLEQFEVAMAKKVSSATIVHFIERCPQLSTLSLAYMPQVDDAVLHAVAKYLPSLRSLKLSALYKTTAASCITLGQSLGTSLTALHFEACERIDDSSLSAIIVPKNQLRVIQLRDCKNIAGSGFEVLSRCTHLQSLTIAKTPLTSATLKTLSDGLMGISRVTSTSNVVNRHMIGYGTPPGATTVTVGCGLTTLDISWCKVTTEASLENLFKACPMLTSIDMNETKVGDRGVNLLVKYCPLLEHVNLSSTKVSDEGILNLLASCGHSLRFLKLAGCWKVSDIVMDKLATSTPSLRYLHLGWVTKITHVRPLYTHCHTLNTLVLDGLRSLKDDSIFPLIQHPETLPNLSVLMINGCSDISSSAIFQLRLARPGLVIVNNQK